MLVLNYIKLIPNFSYDPDRTPEIAAFFNVPFLFRVKNWQDRCNVEIGKIKVCKVKDFCNDRMQMI